MPLLLLPYATTTQALSATTAQVIHGTEPYLTFDNGVTRVTTTDGLLWIMLSDGTRITPAINTSTASNPIQLPVANQRFADIDMLVPTNTSSINLNTLIRAPYNYWGDDDGDGQGTNGVDATGSLRLSITDKNNQAVSRSTILDLCRSPYKVTLTSTTGKLTTQYGVPNSTNFSGRTAIYYISPKAEPKICNVKTNGYNFGMPSTASSSYSRNFPTTGADNLYFDLEIGGVNGSALTWPTVSQGGITATMSTTPSEPNNIRVTLAGPYRSAPNLQQPLELVGYDSSRREVLKYGFKLKKWYINRGTTIEGIGNTTNWCRSFGYRIPQVNDLTNAVDDTGLNRWDPARPSAFGNYFSRTIGAGLFTEWGSMDYYYRAGFVNNYYWTGMGGGYQFTVNSHSGYVYAEFEYSSDYGVCVYP